MSGISRGIETVHEQNIARRRARVLSNHLASVIPQRATVLDVGCGDGEIACLVGQSRPDLTIRGVDVLVRSDTQIAVEPYDGATLPGKDNSFDVVTLVDVLHHCDDPKAVLREAMRVARQAIVIKDHTRNGLAARQTLRLMDWVGNHRYGVALPYNYLSRAEWDCLFAELELKREQSRDRLGLYPWPLNMLFERGLHFVARLAVPRESVDLDSMAEDAQAHAVV
ncbi:MAG: class I SAM-dependent methyltransferase [Bythopirellula sp.]